MKASKTAQEKHTHTQTGHPRQRKNVLEKLGIFVKMLPRFTDANP